MQHIFLESATQSNQLGGITTIIMLVAMLAIFYFFMYRPQKKQEKQATDMRNALAVGDEITTIGGIIGKVVTINDDTLVLETSSNKTKIRIHKWAVKTVDVHAEDAL